MIRRPGVWAMCLAALAVCASPANASSPDTPYETVPLGSFEPQTEGRFASRMSSAGDLDGDGVGDVWIAASDHDVGDMTNVGRIWAMSGRTRSPLYVIDHPEPQSCTGFACGLGSTISNVGDVDGDGISDLAAASSRQNVTAAGASCQAGSAGCNSSQGKAYVFSGAAGKTKLPLYALNDPQPQPNGDFGGVSRAGDIVNAAGSPGKDGVSEILVGAFQNDSPAGCGEQLPISAGCRKDQGQAFLFNGARKLASDASRLVRTLDIPAEDRYVSPATGRCASAASDVTLQYCGGAGIAVQGVGDVDHDGFWDQSVSAPTTGVSKTTGSACFGAVPATAADDCNERQGRVYVYSGRSGALLDKLDDPVAQEGALFGLQAAQSGAPGDVDRDGTADIYVAGFGQDGPSADGQPPLRSEGRAWVFSGGDGSVLLSLLDPTPRADGAFGSSLEATDYNRDAQPDLYLGSSAGSYVFTNGGVLQKAFDASAADDAGQPSGNELGHAVAAPGDLNADGEPDYVSAALAYDVTALNDGQAYVYLSHVPPVAPAPARPPVTDVVGALDPPPPPPPARRRKGRLTAHVTPQANLKPPYRFTTSGRLKLPSGMPRSVGCKGRLSVRITRGRVRINARRVSLRHNCTFSSPAAIFDLRNFKKATPLTFTARFLGNSRVLPVSAPAREGFVLIARRR